MSKIRLMPHRVADASCWTAGPWLVQYPEADPVEAPPFIDDFDYGLELHFGFRVEIDIDRLRERTGLNHSSVVASYAVVDCPASDVRLSTTSPILDDVSEMWVQVTAGMLAGSVELGRGLVTVDAGTANGDNLPVRTGARLLDDATQSIVLEGSLSRFPVEAADFNATHHPADAAWMLEAGYDHPAEPFLGTVRLLVNSAHPAGRAVLAREDRIEHLLYRSALRVDVARQLFSTLARDEQVEMTKDLPEESIVGVASALCNNVLGMDLASTLRLVREDPVRLDALVQQGFRYLQTETR